jgi:SrtB family sortase
MGKKVILCLAVITTICAVVLTFVVIPYLSDARALRREQAALPDLSPFDAHWLEINPDYIGWLKIDGTTIDFPVVRGSDNVKYLTTTFGGQQNRFGAIFMDYRCTGGVVPHILIYGHQAGDGNSDVRHMFGGLTDFLEDGYLAAHPVIVFIANGNLFEFEIFSVRVTDIYDPAYQLDFSDPGSFEAFLERNGAPSGAEQIITLSTCVGVDNDLRLIAQGALRRTVPVTFEYNDGTGWSAVMPDG